jgi:hypothetical protein
MGPTALGSSYGFALANLLIISSMTFNSSAVGWREFPSIRDERGRPLLLLLLLLLEARKRGPTTFTCRTEILLVVVDDDARRENGVGRKQEAIFTQLAKTRAATAL